MLYLAYSDLWLSHLILKKKKNKNPGELKIVIIIKKNCDSSGDSSWWWARREYKQKSEKLVFKGLRKFQSDHRKEFVCSTFL